MSEWKTTEISLLREKYPSLGIAGCTRLLPTRSVSSILTKARDLGLKTERGRSNDLLVGALKKLIETIETNGDIATATADAKSVLRQIRRAA